MGIPSPMKLSDAPTANQGLRRQLGLALATAAVAGESIAVGIFLTPAGMAKSLGSPLWMLLVWVAVGALTLSGAHCYGELAARFPRGAVVGWLWSTVPLAWASGNTSAGASIDVSIEAAIGTSASGASRRPSDGRF